MRQGSILLMGRAGAQLVALLSYPILARWYSPAHFGEFAFFNSILTILLVGASGRYEEALVLSRRRHQAKRIFQLAQFCLLGFVLLLTLFLIFPPVQYYLLEQEKLSSTFYWLLPVLILCGGYWQIVQNWLIRFQQYARLSMAVFLQRLLVFAGAVAAVVFSWSANGLLIGLTAGFVCIFFIGLLYQRQAIHTPLKSLALVATDHKDFPFYSVPSVLISLFIVHLPVLWFSFFNNQAITGSYSIAFTLIMVPVTALRISFGDVFYQRMAQSGDSARMALFIKYCRHYAVILIPAMFLTLLFGQTLISLVMGEAWHAAGSIVSTLAPMILVLGITDLAMTFFQVRKKLKLSLYLHGTQLLLWAIALYAGYLLEDIIYSLRLMNLFSILILATAMTILYQSKKLKSFAIYRT